jgi:hypothetical protein
LGRTIREFTTPQPVWAVADAWARETGYKVLQDGGAWRIYRRGSGIVVSAMFLQVQWQGEWVRVEGWVRADPLQRLVMLFQIPEELDLDLKTPILYIPRNMGRKAMSQLLQRLGQPPVG